MKPGEPPRIATWLLEHFGPEYGQEELAGDLLEGYRRGRSKAWYWRQVLAGIRWRRHLIFLVCAAGAAWALSCSPWVLAVPEPDFPLSPPADMAVHTVIFCALGYLPGMLQRRTRVLVGACIVTALCFLYLSRPYLANHYLIFTAVLVFSLFRKRPPHQLLMGEPEEERKRAIASLTLAMVQETDPQAQKAYELLIARLEERDQKQLKPPSFSSPE